MTRRDEIELLLWRWVADHPWEGPPMSRPQMDQLVDSYLRAEEAAKEWEAMYRETE